MTYVSCYYHAFQGAQQVGHSHYPSATPYVPQIDYNRQVTNSFPFFCRNVFFLFFFLIRFCSEEIIFLTSLKRFLT